jgi:hypothetical protein
MADELELELSYDNNDGNTEDYGEEVDYGVSEDETPAKPDETSDAEDGKSKSKDTKQNGGLKRKVSSELPPPKFYKQLHSRESTDIPPLIFLPPLS